MIGLNRELKLNLERGSAHNNLQRQMKVMNRFPSFSVFVCICTTPSPSRRSHPKGEKG